MYPSPPHCPVPGFPCPRRPQKCPPSPHRSTPLTTAKFLGSVHKNKQTNITCAHAHTHTCTCKHQLYTVIFAHTHARAYVYILYVYIMYRVRRCVKLVLPPPPPPSRTLVFRYFQYVTFLNARLCAAYPISNRAGVAHRRPHAAVAKPGGDGRENSRRWRNLRNGPRNVYETQRTCTNTAMAFRLVDFAGAFARHAVPEYFSEIPTYGDVRFALLYRLPLST